MNDIRLIEGCKKNDRKCQKALYDKYSGQMYRICLRYCTNNGDAADAMQEAFIKAFNAIHQFRNEGNLGGWIRTIVVRCCLAKLKHANNFVTLENAEHIESDYEMKELTNDFNYKRLLAFLKELPAGYKAVFNLFVFEEMTHLEISNELDISESTSRTQLFKARKMLQKLITSDVQLKQDLLL